MNISTVAKASLAPAAVVAVGVLTAGGALSMWTIGKLAIAFPNKPIRDLTERVYHLAADMRRRITIADAGESADRIRPDDYESRPWGGGVNSVSA